MQVGRYKSPDEHPFFPEYLPEPILPPMRYPKVSFCERKAVELSMLALVFVLEWSIVDASAIRLNLCTR